MIMISAQETLNTWYMNRDSKDSVKLYHSIFMYKYLDYDKAERMVYFEPLEVYCRMVNRYKYNDDSVWNWIQCQYKPCLDSIIGDDKK